MSKAADYDAIVIGGGFFGCCLALFLRSVCGRVLVIEAEDDLLQRASRVNQARVHTGFHYPRSMLTALRSRRLQERFVADFPDAVVADFDMLYALARTRSKVSASRFETMFKALDAPFAPASRSQAALFDPARIEAVFACREFAFDWRVLQSRLRDRLAAAGVEVRLGVRAERVAAFGEGGVVVTDEGLETTAGAVFNVTYAGLNRLALDSGLAPLSLKHELADVALVRPPEELAGLAVTLMDGPFFSTMPYPSRGLNSLTHVRYTPHHAWTDAASGASPYAIAEGLAKDSRVRAMIQDSARYLPCIAACEPVESLFEVKTILTRNERDDGRPILLRRHADAPWLTSILGAKIDNVFDLFDALPEVDPRWADATADPWLA